MKNFADNPKAVTIGAIAVVLMMAWQMRQHPAGNVKLPEADEEITASAPVVREPTSTAQKQEPVVATQNPQDSVAKAPQRPQDLLLNEIRATKACYESENCDFPQTDSRSYYLAVGQKLRDLLRDYRLQFGDDEANFAEMQLLALDFIHSEDGYLQEEALNMFSSLPPAGDNLEAITRGLGETPNPLLVEQAMEEMKRYVGTNDEALVHDYLRELLAHGGVFSSEAAVRNILSFINSRSYPVYENVARHLPPQTTVGQYLRTALDEYLRLQSGG